MKIYIETYSDGRKGYGNTPAINEIKDLQIISTEEVEVEDSQGENFLDNPDAYTLEINDDIGLVKEKT